MNKMIKTLLSVVIVSLSAFNMPLTGSKESIPNQNLIIQTNGEASAIDVTPMELYEPNIEKIKNKMCQEIIELGLIEDRQEWFLAYKDIIVKYVKWFGMPQTIFDAYTEEEITLICRVVETECYDQDFMSKCNVASVILNRVEQGGEFGGSVTEVITKKNQFAYYRENITQDTILSIMYVYEIGDTTDGCIAFRSDRSPETWYGWKRMFTDEAGHHYYKKMEDQNE